MFRHALGTLKAEKDADAIRHGGWTECGVDSGPQG